MHSDINVSGLYCIKSATGTTIVKVCLSSTKHTAKFKKCWDFNRCTCFKQIYKGAWGELAQVGQHINI